ncbi:MAG: riboflavin biosynthesis protein RibD [Acidobacteria bacterium 13_1_20CM_2_68_7]|nr:MAG: riboflavin biosynthesis protein RibD [Acidobacteria bacterium 13_1_20CM_2_68_7]
MSREGARFLRLALRLAARGEGETSPNPMVGAVLVRDGRVVGSGYHTRAGAPHAEAVALEQAGSRAHGSVLYVNLEPCCHFGRTPPCVDAIVAAGVREVVACMRDPDPRVRGKGFRALGTAGVRVRVGFLEREARRLNERFLRRVAAGRPFVTLKAGMSLDGRIATRSGESKWITSQRARAAGRELRCAHDAVMVGVNTVLRDDPRLTAAPARREGAGTMLRPLPARVVLDGRLRTPPGARLLRAAGGQPIIVTLPGAPARRRRRLERAGALVLEVAGRDGRISVGGALRELGRRGISSVLIEGGSELLGSALDERLGDRLVVFVAGRLIGGRRSLPVFGGRGALQLRQAPRLRDVTVRTVGPDLRVEGRLEFPRRGGG